jgi:hypothetical protein
MRPISVKEVFVMSKITRILAALIAVFTGQKRNEAIRKFVQDAWTCNHGFIKNLEGVFVPVSEVWEETLEILRINPVPIVVRMPSAHRPAALNTIGNAANFWR